MRSRRTARGVVLAGAAMALMAGCLPSPLTVAGPGRSGGGPAAWQDPRSHPAGAGLASPTPASGKSRDPRPVVSVSPDFLVTGDHSLSPEVLKRLRRAERVSASAVMGLGSTAVGGRTLTVAAVDPWAYRSFAPPRTAGVQRVWSAVAHGEAVIAHGSARALGIPPGGSITLGGHNRTQLRVGALATTVPGIDVVVSRATGRRIGIERATAVVLSTGKEGTGRLAKVLRSIVGSGVRVDVLGHRPDKPVRRRAFLTGSTAAQAFGSFSYRYFPDGTIEPDPEWVDTNIRTEEVPILGEITCHRLVFHQLRGALREIVKRGLASEINPAQYGGCYVPRFIGRDPSNSVSLHTWGIAIDLNVAANQRGSGGNIDPRVVRVFKSWGFAWGGDWDWPDPMHFELAGLLRNAES